MPNAEWPSVRAETRALHEGWDGPAVPIRARQPGDGQRQSATSGMSLPCARYSARARSACRASPASRRPPRAPSPGTRSMTSATRWKRSSRLRTTMSNGVVVVPSSMKPRTWKLSWFVALVDQAMDQAGIAVIGEDHRLVHGEQGVEIVLGQAVRMLRFRLQRHQVDHIDNADLAGRAAAGAADRPRPAPPASGRRRRRPSRRPVRCPGRCCPMARCRCPGCSA